MKAEYQRVDINQAQSCNKDSTFKDNYHSTINQSPKDKHFCWFKMNRE